MNMQSLGPSGVVLHNVVLWPCFALFSGILMVQARICSACACGARKRPGDPERQTRRHSLVVSWETPQDRSSRALWVYCALLSLLRLLPAPVFAQGLSLLWKKR